MTRSRLIFLIRFTTLAVVCWLLGMPLSVLAFVGPVALMMPVLPQSGCPAICSTFPTSISITFAGVANSGSTLCGNLNTTYVFSPAFPVTCCAGGSVGSPSGSNISSDTGSAAQACFQNSGGFLKLTSDSTPAANIPGCFCCDISGSPSGGHFSLTTATAIPADCAVSGTYNLTFSSQVGTCCDYSGASSTVVV